VSLRAAMPIRQFPDGARSVFLAGFAKVVRSSKRNKAATKL